MASWDELVGLRKGVIVGVLAASVAGAIGIMGNILKIHMGSSGGSLCHTDGTQIVTWTDIAVGISRPTTITYTSGLTGFAMATAAGTSTFGATLTEDLGMRFETRKGTTAHIYDFRTYIGGDINTILKSDTSGGWIFGPSGTTALGGKNLFYGSIFAGGDKSIEYAGILAIGTNCNINSTTSSAAGRTNATRNGAGIWMANRIDAANLVMKIMVNNPTDAVDVNALDAATLTGNREWAFPVSLSVGTGTTTNLTVTGSLNMATSGAAFTAHASYPYFGSKGANFLLPSGQLFMCGGCYYESAWKNTTLNAAGGYIAINQVSALTSNLITIGSQQTYNAAAGTTISPIVVFSITGEGAHSFGAPSAGIAGFHTFYGNISLLNTTSANSDKGIGYNCYYDASRNFNRVATAPCGMAMIFAPNTGASDAGIYFVANAPGDAVNAAAAITAMGYHSGRWRFGKTDSATTRKPQHLLYGGGINLVNICASVAGGGPGLSDATYFLYGNRAGTSRWEVGISEATRAGAVGTETAPCIYWFSYANASYVGGCDYLGQWYHYCSSGVTLTLDKGGSACLQFNDTGSADVLLEAIHGGGLRFYSYYSSAWNDGGNFYQGLWTLPRIAIGRSASASTGINWYSSSYSAWCMYMSPPSTDNCGPGVAFKSPAAGSIVTSWALRSFIEGGTGYGWTWETGSSTGNPNICCELSSVDGSMKIYGRLISGTTSGTTTCQNFHYGYAGAVAHNFYNRATSAASVMLLQTYQTTGSVDMLLCYDGSTNYLGGIYSNTDLNTTQFVTSSDARLKFDEKTFLALSLVRECPVLDYQRRSCPGKREKGYFAQITARYFPEAVMIGDDESLRPWGVDYGRVTPYLHRAIQELADQNDELKLENSLLRSRIETLERRLTA